MRGEGVQTEPVRLLFHTAVPFLVLLTALTLLLGPAHVAAQDEDPGLTPSVGGTIGTPGIGIEAGIRPWERFGFRVGLSWIPYEHDIEEEDVTGTISPPSPVTRLTADFFPRAGVFHLSLGIHHYSGGISGRAVPSEGIEINEREYSPEEIGVFTARVWGRQTAPFIGLGWQGRSGRVQPYVDLGALLTGSPRVSVHVSGVIADDPQFQNDLDEEIREIEDELSAFRIFPHISFGMRFRIGD